METRVVHSGGEFANSSDYVYIGRPSKWGNPFKIGEDGGREECIERCRKWLCGEIILPNRNPPTLQEILSELTGKKLGCWCFPEPCHGELYVAIIKAGKLC